MRTDNQTLQRNSLKLQVLLKETSSNAYTLSVPSFYNVFFYHGVQPPVGQGSSFTRFLDHTQRRTTFGRTPLDERSVHRGDLYLTTHNIHKRQTSMTPLGFEPTIPVGEWPPSHALDRAATETGECELY